MGRFKTTEEKTTKRLAKIAERKLLQQEASEKAETAKLPEKIIRRPAHDPMIVNFGQDSLRQKKG